MLRGKNVLLGVTASIAAYKSAFLVRLLVKAGANVRVIMTPSAAHFITPLTLSTLSKNPVSIEYFDGKTGAWHSHIELAEWADLMLIAPLSANTLAKLAQGITDNLLMATYLSSRAPIYFAPAMDLEMYRHESVRTNLDILASRGHFIIPPTSGELASGLEGEGRMEEPEGILKAIEGFISEESRLKGKKVLVTAGPTVEHIDAVRYISNHSSGKMGLALALEAKRNGAEVTLIHGPLSVRVPDGFNVIPVTSAREMLKACLKEADKDIIIMSAAVADYTPVMTHDHKLKKSESALNIELKPTEDILKTLGTQKKAGQFLCGFALETDNQEANAIKKLESKNLDLIVLNSPSESGTGFGHDTNQVTFIRKDKKVEKFPLKPKREVARDIISYIAQLI